MVREKRKKLEIYHDIIVAIKEEASSGDEVKPTRVQYKCNMSYDKMSNYLIELNKKQMIVTFPISITEKGEKFMKDYSKIKEFTEKMELEYLVEQEIQHE